MVKVTGRLISEAGQDPRDLPAYSSTEAARYLRMPEATLRSWVVGRPYPTTGAQRFFRPVSHLPEDGRPVLSFVNTVEADVLEAITHHESIRLHKVRTA